MSYEVAFTYQEATANLVIWDDGETATLHTLTSKFRRRGAGRAVLILALDYADLKGLDVVLEVMPFGDAPRMKEPDLKAWYMTFGFKMSSNHTMFRDRPREVEGTTE